MDPTCVRSGLLLGTGHRCCLPSSQRRQESPLGWPFQPCWGHCNNVIGRRAGSGCPGKERKSSSLFDGTLLFFQNHRQLSEAIAISCTSLETVAIEQLDVSALLPPTTSTIHQRPPLWLEQHTDDLIARSRKVNVCASSLTTSLTQSRAGSVDSSDAPRRVVAVHNRCDSLVAAHLRVETEEVPALTAAVRVPSAQRLYSDLGEAGPGDTAIGGAPPMPLSKAECQLMARGGFVAQLAASAEVTPNLCVRSMDLSYNQLCDEDLVPLT